ncbi:DUF6925 family protein [methane-oxidizing endosymbiont of Gigantopelta aegis]|uniref:DUF6925 family protein n=1 Tax=methane-oxidizing endosymbiont of Gigantopelta aegis TaxID=2794938 RepID=UPI0018DEA739|nr:hypothetical protein [methane-oxidizing endosymbiont of Gigantopelta aegis]
MAVNQDIRTVLRKHLEKPASSFSIGCFGAIAEFHRIPSEPVDVTEYGHALQSITAQGAIQITLQLAITPIAYEGISKNAKYWQQGVVFCLPQAQARMSQRQHIAELGPDCEALQEKHQSAILFDLGLGAENIDFCIRTEDGALIDALRQCKGQSFFEINNELKDNILRLSPHRVILSRIGRIEVYQSIGLEKTPAGSHTHLLPKLLATGRTHSANIPVPDGYLPVLSLYPEHALGPATDDNRQMNTKLFDEFQWLLNKWGRRAYVEEKQRVQHAILSGEKPENYTMATERHVRAAVKVTIRQMCYQYPDLENVYLWNSFF